ncbi:L,D-transpeptidase [Psychrobacter phenylpyruvicus]|uniref:Probable L,D-transpeptidase YbiS n=1 Tax=Psychrobacter phenylpyruvicus TaxID=29432 RepID=A0A379LMJ5_9GAMM|nr:L,D-transpeptidase [Psychrobacter phenylpyruvicus]SUD90994.1 Probable L,D-transpeptidase YbiS precursor [Psychrobacter phenylpyruvicus]
MPNLKIFEKLTPKIVVNIAKQTLTLTLPNEQGDFDSHEFTISTAKNGIGSQEGSGCTPLGKHFIAEKIGANTPINSVFVGRVPTGEIYDEDLDKQYPNRDWILSRILWLSGCEEGLNKGENDQGCCDTYQRYIYIHGTPDTEPMGTPLSHGCVRMRNDELMWLFEQVEEGTPVEIIAG